MDPLIAEGLKFGIIALMTYAQNKGMTEDQIDQVFREAKIGLLLRDPAKIPD